MQEIPPDIQYFNGMVVFGVRGVPEESIKNLKIEQIKQTFVINAKTFAINSQGLLVKMTKG